MLWKTVAGRCIHQGTHGIQVRQNILYRWLTFDSDAIQTLLHRRHPSRAGLHYIHALTLAARANPAPSCLLGLGGAGVAHALAPYFTGYPLYAVESSLEIIEVSATWFMTAQIKNLTVIHQDAFLHLQQTEDRYQHLMIDLFNAHSFPSHCNTSEFFDLCRRALLPEGIMAINLANPTEQWPIFLHIREHFKQCTVSIPVKGTANMVILAYNGKSVNPLLTILNKHADLKQLTWDSKWGCVARLGKVDYA